MIIYNWQYSQNKKIKLVDIALWCQDNSSVMSNVIADSKSILGSSFKICVDKYNYLINGNYFEIYATWILYNIVIIILLFDYIVIKHLQCLIWLPELVFHVAL